MDHTVPTEGASIQVSSSANGSILMQDMNIKVEPQFLEAVILPNDDDVQENEATIHYKESPKSLEEVVENFLLANPGFLDVYVTNHISIGKIYKWIYLKEEHLSQVKKGQKLNKTKVTATKDALSQETYPGPSGVYCTTLNNVSETMPVVVEEVNSTQNNDVKEEKKALSVPTSVAKINRRKLSKPNRITSGYVKEEIGRNDVRNTTLPSNYFIERCQKCDRAFFSYLSFKLHSCVSTEAQILTCSHCEAVFRDLALFTKHVCVKSCTFKDCNTQFFCTEQFNRHLASHPNEHPYQCQHCESIFNEKSQLQTHLQSQHGIRAFQCERCGKRFTQSGNLKRHIRLHNGERPYKCSICQRAFSDQSHLKYHLKQHSGHKPFRCTQCDKAFLTSTNLKQHAATHLEKIFYCSECGKEFKSGAEMKRHEEAQHRPKSLSCTHCGRLFSKPSLLKSHMVDTGNKPYTCKYCSIVLPCAGRIKAHARTHTLESPRYKCPDCDMLFDKGSNLKSHLRTHLQFRPFECSECGKCFTQSGNLRRHLRIHSGEKPFKCGQCTLAFSDQSHLKYHTIQAHSAVRPFPCTVCGKGFITSSKLKSHSRVHDPERNGKPKVTELEPEPATIPAFE